MDRISGLPNELLVKILLFLPTKVAVSTSIFSKRWEFLWMWLPKLEYDDALYSVSEGKKLRSFIDRNLLLHRAPVIDIFHLRLSGSNCKPEDIKLWVSVAVSRRVRELEVRFTFNPIEPNVLPSSLYTCKSLVTLILFGDILLDVPRMVCLASLENLQLLNVRYMSEESRQRFISICPVLKRLIVVCRRSDNMGMLTVITKTLRTLSLYIPDKCKLDGYVINTPSLGYFRLVDLNSKNPYCLIETMPKLKKAYVSVEFLDIKSLIRSITCVKHLTICSRAATYGDGFVFNQLGYLNLCVCNKNYFNLLVRFLKDSPNVLVLDLFQNDYHKKDDLVNCVWNQPSTVPASISSSLQTFSWSGYSGTPEERDATVYILKNARRLKTTTIKSLERQVPKLVMVKELTLSYRASTMCQLAFD